MSSPTEFGRRGVATAPAAPAYGLAPKKAKPPNADAGAPSPLAPFLRFCFSFEGRIKRRDFWLGELALTVLVYTGTVAFSVTAPGADHPVLMILSVLLYLAMFLTVLWSSLALRVKRWHDRDKSGFWIFIAFIPLIGGFWELVELGFLDGTSGDNRFGRSPKWFPELEFV
jgi:uncharacterized membrane protein YhaH (DUF805 family)